jgi:beta-galactosidase
VRYLAAWPDAALLARLMQRMATEAGLATKSLPRDLRLRRAGDTVFAINYGPEPIDLTTINDQPFIIGDTVLGPASVAAWRQPSV